MPAALCALPLPPRVGGRAEARGEAREKGARCGSSIMQAPEETYQSQNREDQEHRGNDKADNRDTFLVCLSGSQNSQDDSYESDDSADPVEKAN